MGKRIITQRRGRGTTTYKAHSHRWKFSIKHRQYDTTEQTGVVHGKVVYKGVADAFDLPYVDVDTLDETLDITSGVRFHFGEVILSALVRSLLIILFNISLVNLLLIEAIILISSIFHHSNINLPKNFEKALSFIIVTPSIHWVHHHKRQSETDANYSTIFSWWDKIFNSKSNFTRKVGMPIGVQGDREQNLLNLILRPIKK